MKEEKLVVNQDAILLECTSDINIIYRSAAKCEVYPKHLVQLNLPWTILNYILRALKCKKYTLY